MSQSFEPPSRNKEQNNTPHKDFDLGNHHKGTVQFVTDINFIHS